MPLPLAPFIPLAVRFGMVAASTALLKIGRAHV